MKRGWMIRMATAFAVLLPSLVQAQCAICTKTAQQLGEGPAKGLNAGILYMMITPLLIMAFIGYRWWKREKQVMG